jgi:8-oxo-dGTP diphosphatase
MDQWLHVVAAVIDDGCDNILIARRPEHLHQGGLWEFPGGKVEKGESARDALARELSEELGIAMKSARPLIRIRHAYSDRRVLLDVWRVLQFSGTAHGREGQPIRWVATHELPHYSYPAANFPIVTAARLPSLYLITPEPGSRIQWPIFLEGLRRCVASGIRLVQFRAKTVPSSEYRELARQVIAICHEGGAKVLLNAASEVASALGSDGVHLSASRLMELHDRPLPAGLWVAASCHNAEELALAAKIGVDFAVLSPVQRTASHPDCEPVGWSAFGSLVEWCPLPVFALGGVSREDLELSWQQGGQGIAGIRALWRE